MSSLCPGGPSDSPTPTTSGTAIVNCKMRKSPDDLAKLKLAQMDRKSLEIKCFQLTKENKTLKESLSQAFKDKNGFEMKNLKLRDELLEKDDKVHQLMNQIEDLELQLESCVCGNEGQAQVKGSRIKHEVMDIVDHDQGPKPSLSFKLAMDILNDYHQIKSKTENNLRAGAKDGHGEEKPRPLDMDKTDVVADSGSIEMSGNAGTSSQIPTDHPHGDSNSSDGLSESGSKNKKSNIPCTSTVKKIKPSELKVNQGNTESMKLRPRPYNCSICYKKFTTKDILKRHSLSHSAEKPFKCMVCPKMFTLHQGLKKHMRIHTGEKPYQCPQCSKFFTWNQTLTKHMKTHKQKTLFNKCTRCHLAFLFKCELNCHSCLEHSQKQA